MILKPTAEMLAAESARVGDLATARGLVRYAASLATRTPEDHFADMMDQAIKRLMVGSHAGRIG
jgi:hypothetical protein